MKGHAMGKKSARFAQTMLFLCTLSLAALSDPPDRVYAAAQDQGIISGTCFYDANKNGKRDASDAGMAGIQIKLTKLCIFNSGDNQTATTDAEGNYEFQGLGRGFYRVQAVLEGADQNTSPNPATTRVGIFFKNRTVDFGISRSAVSSTLSLSGHVYLSPLRGEGKASPASGAHIAVSTDINGNGIIEANEAAHATAGTDGSYTVSAPVLLGASTLVAFTKDGYAGLFKTIAVHSTNAISAFDGTLSAMNDLSQDKSGKWKDEAGEVEICNV